MTDRATTVEAGYKERYAAFLDLLGFKVLVESAEHDGNEQERLEEVLDLLSQTLCNYPLLGSRFSYFSDCIILTSDATPVALWDICHSVGTLTRNLLQFDVFVRGGITRGGAFHSPQYVYGTAISRAVNLEKKAEGALTLLSPEVYEDAQALGQNFLELLETDGPDRFFVHYLLDFADYHRTPALPGKVVLDQDAKRIAFFVSRRLLNDTGGVLEKAQWFRDYWNRTVARGDGYPAIEADSSLVEPDGPRTRIVRRSLSQSG